MTLKPLKQLKHLSPYDEIPMGDYPKLKKCTTFPLRQCCNWGSSNGCEWDRCQYMKYDDSRSIYDERRWICTAPEENTIVENIIPSFTKNELDIIKSCVELRLGRPNSMNFNYQEIDSLYKNKLFY
jgi:hypothetical protein